MHDSGRREIVGAGNGKGVLVFFLSKKEEEVHFPKGPSVRDGRKNRTWSG